jgi:Flp pilus assembly protein TadD
LDYNEFIRLSPKDVDGWNNRGIAYANKGEHDRAISDYTEAIRLSPSTSFTVVQQGRQL